MPATVPDVTLPMETALARIDALRRVLNEALLGK